MKAILGERQHRVLRGGRMTKWKGRAASMSPMLGQLVASVSPLALALGAAITVSGGGAAAQDICTAAGGGVYNCAGPSTTEQALSVDGGSLTVNLDDTATVDAASGYGFDLRKYGSDGGLTFTQATGGGAITGGTSGISASNFGTGALAITATGTVTGAAFGIDARHARDGALSVTASGTVTGGAYGINTRHYGDGALSVTASGTVTGNEYGITARHYGDGLLSIATTGMVTGTASDGIAARNTDNAEGGVAVNANVVTGGDEGIYADNNGTGALTVTATGAVTGQSGDGIRADSGGFDFYTYSVTGTDLTIDVTEVSGGNYGVRASNQGSGALTVTATGAVTGQGSDGIRATNGNYFAGSGTDLTIEVEGVSGGDRGIYAYNAGTGALAITAGGDVAGEGRDGIWALNGGNYGPNGTDLTIETAGVTGAEDGIQARNSGTGAMSITTAGAVTGQAGDGIQALNGAYGYGTDLSITAGGDISGGASGIHADNNGTGALTIIAAGAVSGAYGDGIGARNDGTDLRIEASEVSGRNVGIYADNDGTGALTIKATGAVTSTNSDGIRADNRFLGTDLTIEASEVSGGRSGIGADNYGGGALTITAAGAVTGASRDGIEARNEGTDLTIEASEVSGRYDGIEARNRGTGALTITATGAVTGQEDDGIHARNSGTYYGGAGTDLTVTAEATVSGGDDGIEAISLGTGVLTITAADTVTGASGNGIYASNGNYYGGAGTDLTIDAEAGVSGGESGINALNGGTGALTITAAGAVTGTRAFGVLALNRGTDLTMASDAGVSGAYSGMVGINYGTGGLAIAATGAVTGTGGNGITARGYGTDLTIEATDVSGQFDGIAARNSGTGALTVTATGAVEGTDELGIDAYAAASASGDVTVTARGDVTGAREAIRVDNQGSGATVVRAEGTLTGGEGYAALSASSAASGTDMTIEVVDATGATGIDANHLGTGELTVTATGTVTGTAGDGIYARSRGTDLTITAAADVTGYNGITAINRGTGALTVETTGTVTGDGSSGYNAPYGSFGIRAGNGGTDLTITASGAVTGGGYGISAFNAGSGALTITATGAVTGTGENSYAYGVFARNGGTDLTIAAADVTGADDGIEARNYGSGALTITAEATVMGTARDGIVAENAGTELTIAATGDVTGGRTGIEARNNGTGALTITAEATVMGTARDGIVAENAGTDLTIAATGDVTGKYHGIVARNEGTGALTIETTGTVTGAPAGPSGGTGILANNGGTDSSGERYGTDLTITASNVSGVHYGIKARNEGTGALTITANGAVTGPLRVGIDAINNGTDLVVTAGSDVSGHYAGVAANNTGSGALTITATGAVTGTGTGAFGVLASNSGTDLTIVAASVSGGQDGITARNSGTGALTITATGAVEGTDELGINAYAAASAAGDVTVTARGDVTGGQEAIRVDNQGSGATVVRAEGTLTGGGGYAALAASSAASGTDMIIEVVDATGATGIDANHLGTGDLTVTATGTVTGTAGDGINARNTDNADGGVTVNANVVTGSDRGIDASNYGSGALTISATGAVTGMGGIYADNNYSALTINATGSVTATNGFGIWARNEGTDLTINVAAVSSVYDGINAGNNTTGALSITATGAVTGESRNGIIARNGGGSAYYGTDLTITADAGVTGADDGINASNWGRGALSITTTGAVAGQGNDGIRARNGGFSYYGYAFGTDLTITAGGDVTGGMNGIVTDHRGTGALGVTMAGAVTGGTGAGVENAATSQGGQFVLQDGGSMQAESGLAFADLADGSTGDASSTLDIAGALNGDAQMGAGSDTLILRDTATLGAGITLDGDAGAESGIAGQIDRLEFAGWTGSFDAVQALNWESVVLSENAVVTFAEGSAAGTAGGDLTVEIGADATARLAGDFTLDGALANGGLLDLSTAAPSVGTQLRVTGDYSAASDLLIDADLSSGGGTDNTVEGDAAFTDQILIGGNVTGTTTVTVNNTGDGLALTDLDGNGQVDANEGLLFAQAQGSAAADSFVLAAPIIDGAFMAEVYSFGPDASVSGAWDYVLGTVFSPATPGYESLPYTLMGFARARSLASRQGGQQWLVGGAPAGGNGSPETAGGGGARDPGLALAPRRGIWIAAEGSRWDVTPQQSTTGLDFDLDLWRIRAGFETIAMEAASGTMTVGLDFFAGNGTLDAHAEAGSTSTSTDAYGGGLTLTWYGDDGLYADGQLSFVSSDSDISSGTLGTVATGVGGSATVLSVELGKRFGLQSGWTVIPQGQLSWASMSFDSFTGSSGETVTPEDWNSLLLRLGAAAERRWQVESGGQASFYGLANVNHEFNADTTVDVSGTKLTSKLPDWTAELGIGGAYDWNDGRGRLFGEVTVSEALGSGDLSGISGTLGFSLRF
jgi:hypothetical protein